MKKPKALEEARKMTEQVVGDHVRPVKCYCCGQPMYYHDDSRHVPEVALLVNNHKNVFAHEDCWELIKTLIHVPWPPHPHRKKRKPLATPPPVKL
ncbi:MAG: hypothetical protein ACLQVW_06435 [Limisphaerales bacterium]